MHPPRFPLHVSAVALCMAVLAVAAVTSSRAQGIPGGDPNRCLAGKTKCVSKKVKGLLKCREKCQKAPTKCGQAEVDCIAKVRAKFDGGTIPANACFAKLEARADAARPTSVCTTTGDTAAVEAQLDGLVDDVLGVLEATSPSGCVIEHLPATGQTTCYDGDGNVRACAGTGQDGEVRAGGALAFQDNGDGTIIDFNTLFIWEKKDDDGVLHDKDNCYPWRGICSGDGTTTCARDADCATVGGTCDAGDCQSASPNGVTVFEWIDLLNNPPGYAGYTDWRVPNIRELETIVDYGTSGLAVAAPFDTGCTLGCTVTTCSCTSSAGYWSSTSDAQVPDRAWNVQFTNGDDGRSFKGFNQRVRAVRGGL